MSAWKVCLCAGIVALSAAVAQATLIDSFSGGKQSLVVDPETHANSQQVATGAALGGFRDIALQWSSGDLEFANVSTASGKFTFTQSTAEGTAAIAWDGADTPDVLSYSLSKNLLSDGSNGFSVHIFSVTGTDIGLTMTVYTDATHASQYATTLVAGGARDVTLPFGYFTRSGNESADFANVGAIVLAVDGIGRMGSDITLGSIRTVPVPEPSTLVLIALGAVATAIGWRRRK